MAEVLTAVRPTGIPWRSKITEALGPNEHRMLYAIIDAILIAVQKDSTAPKRRSRNVSYISDNEYQHFVSRLNKDTGILDHASVEDLDEFLAEKPSDELLFQQLLQGMLLHLPQEKMKLLSGVLWALNKYVDARTRSSGCVLDVLRN